MKMDLLVKSFSRLTSSNQHVYSRTMYCFTSYASLSRATFPVIGIQGQPLQAANFVRKNFLQQNEVNLQRQLSNSFSSLSLSNTKVFVNKLTYGNSLVNQLLPFMPSIPHRNVTVVSRNRGKRKTAKIIIKRFRRLGNGLWVRRQSGYKKRMWVKLLRKGNPSLIWRHRRHLICNRWQSKLLDKMVTDYWKKQKWYVDDPYKGYTDESLFYYHPLKLPWNKKGKPDDHYKYALHRYRQSNILRIRRKKAHNEVIHSHRQKPIPPAHMGYTCVG
ncbi:uncharacterized protein LOC143464780 [Clavelina lepadiformis]|uniref:uncharacterized protein LOC143464780 n=1 Tax=Clavelina lepadiformis TaxID=159417 RepID=UPI004041CA8A